MEKKCKSAKYNVLLHFFYRIIYCTNSNYSHFTLHFLVYNNNYSTCMYYFPRIAKENNT